MSVWTQSSQWPKHSGVVRLPEFKIVLVLPVLVFVSIVALAQRPAPTPTVPSPLGPGTSGPVFRTIPTSGQIALAAAERSENGTCLLPPLDLASGPVSEGEQLRIPGEARREYQGACSALMKNKYPDAEKHLRK